MNERAIENFRNSGMIEKYQQIIKESQQTEMLSNAWKQRADEIDRIKQKIMRYEEIITRLRLRIEELKQ